MKAISILQAALFATRLRALLPECSGRCFKRVRINGCVFNGPCRFLMFRQTPRKTDSFDRIQMSIPELITSKSKINACGSHSSGQVESEAPQTVDFEYSGDFLFLLKTRCRMQFDVWLRARRWTPRGSLTRSWHSSTLPLVYDHKL